MKKVTYLSERAGAPLRDYLLSAGREIVTIKSEDVVDEGISDHPDIFLCKMGISDDSPVYFAEKDNLGKDYPDDVSFNAACTGKYFIHNLSFTDGNLLAAAKSSGMTLIDVRQGYTKCSIVIVDEDAIITYDDGIVKACRPYPELKVLKVSPGFVRLDGFDTGFIGGASGRVGNEVIFNGDLFRHPDFESIARFIEDRGLKCRWFSEYPLTDIGSIL